MAECPRVLVIAGSDSSGGAGIQADIKTLTRFGVYAATAVTAVTVQSTTGVTAIHPIPTDSVAGQIDAVLGDIGADAVKIGMLGEPALIETVAKALKNFKGPIVLDPVMVATSGDRLLPISAIEALKKILLPKAMVVTPNLPEAGLLTGLKIATDKDMIAAGKKLLSLSGQAVVMKGGHMNTTTVTDFLIAGDDVRSLSAPRLNTPNTHGTGCTFSSAMAAGLGHGWSLNKAFTMAHGFVHDAIKTAPSLGAGAGPLNHLTAKIQAHDT